MTATLRLQQRHILKVKEATNGIWIRKVKCNRIVWCAFGAGGDDLFENPEPKRCRASKSHDANNDNSNEAFTCAAIKAALEKPGKHWAIGDFSALVRRESWLCAEGG